MESSLSLMQLLDQSDAYRRRIKDAYSAKAFACVTQCPSVLLQTLLLRCIENTRQMQLMSLNRGDVYTTLAQWLQVGLTPVYVLFACLIAAFAQLHRSRSSICAGCFVRKEPGACAALLGCLLQDSLQ
jgi:hypothetical protein